MGLARIDWDSIIFSTSSDIQSTYDNFDVLLHSILDNYYPLRYVTVTSRDPSFVTPYIKCLLRRKNSLMRAGQIEKAASLAKVIGDAIIKFNSASLLGSNERPVDVSKMWQKVVQLTGKQRRKPYDASI